MYYQYPDYYQQLEQRLRNLELENEALRARIEQIKPIHIDNINYKIQELSVQELKGTLNIGLTALSDPDELKKWLKDAEGEDVHLEDLEQEGDQLGHQNHVVPQGQHSDDG